MRDCSKASARFWTDHNGQSWIVPQIRGRLKMRIPAHRALREFVLHRDGYTCRHCGCSARNELVADHIVSRRNGGQHHPKNMQCLCGSCNSRKAATVDRRRAA